MAGFTIMAQKKKPNLKELKKAVAMLPTNATTMPFNFNITFTPGEFESIRDSLLEKYIGQLRRKRIHREKIEAAFSSLMANLTMLHTLSNKSWIMLGRSTTSYPRGRYNAVGAQFDVLNPIIDWMGKMKYINLKVAPRTTTKPKGKKNSKKSYHKPSRFRPSSKLSFYLKNYNLGLANVRNASKFEPIVLKKGDDNTPPVKDLLNYKDNAETLMWRKNLSRINERIFSAKLTINSQPLAPQPLRRIFCRNTFELGGRFYASDYQTFSKRKGERQKLKINGLSTTEYDYSGLHINLLYTDHGLQLEKDAYSVPGFDSKYRDVFKLVLLIAVNSKSRLSALRALNQAAVKRRSPLDEKSFKNISYLDLKEMLEAFEEYHSGILNRFYKENGLRLQRTDSDLAEKIMLRYLDHTPNSPHPILPIHDSFIVVRKDGPLLKRIMEEIYEEETGFKITVRKTY